MNHEAADDAVEDAVVVVALQAQLHEVSARQRRLLRPQLHFQLPVRRLQHNLPLGRGLHVIDVAHGSRGVKEGRGTRERGVCTVCSLFEPGEQRS